MPQSITRARFEGELRQPAQRLGRSRFGVGALGTMALSVALACSLSVPFALTGCSSGGGDTAESERVLSYVSPYDWDSNLSTEDGRYVYSEDGEVKSRLGIDVSDHQNSVNWAAVAQDGIEFAMLRVGNRGSSEGQLYEDALFADNVLGVQSVGMPFGVYFFSQAVNEDEAREEAQFVLETLSSYGLSPDSLAYPVVFDQEPVEGEGRANDLSSDQLTANALAFCQTIEEAGYRPMVYGNQNDMAQRDIDSLEAYPVWYAEYGTAQPSADFDFVMWQYSNSGSVRGIDTEVDLNIYMVDERAGTYE